MVHCERPCFRWRLQSDSSQRQSFWAISFNLPSSMRRLYECPMDTQSVCIVRVDLWRWGYSLDGSEFTDCRFEDSSFYEVNFDGSQWSDCIANDDFRYSSFKNVFTKCQSEYWTWQMWILRMQLWKCKRIQRTHHKRLTRRPERSVLVAVLMRTPPAINKLRKGSLFKETYNLDWALYERR